MICSKCGGALQKVVVGNVIDYQHYQGYCPPAAIQVLSEKQVLTLASLLRPIEAA